ncbi:alpha/beta hydrolase family protein [Daejeonella lutea]|nr:alpha/beta fold hydrolase [Daejeonella lutea]
MKTSASIFILLVVTFTTLAQPISGQWSGTLNAGAMKLKVVFHITKTESGYSSTMDSPDQGAMKIPVTATTFEAPNLKLEISKLQIEYKGVLKNDTLSGTFIQSGMPIPLTLTKTLIPASKRPQEPKPPFSYYTEDLTFRNSAANISLAGTLTLPAKDGNYPAVILIGGSGPQNRDGEIAGHKPLLVLADHLTKNGIAVFRFDDRGVGKSEGNFQTASIPDFTSDVESALAYLKTRKEINKQKIGLVGHSEGGIIAPMLAAKSPDVKFIVMLAGPGLPGYKLLLLQMEKMQRAMGVPDKMVQESAKFYGEAYQMIWESPENDPSLKTRVGKYVTFQMGIQAPEGAANGVVSSITNPWMVSFLKYDPVPVLSRVKIPVLALTGEKDVQVLPAENLAGIKNILTESGNKNFTVKEYPGLNHMFQTCTTCYPFEALEETFAPEVLKDVTEWVLGRTK